MATLVFGTDSSTTYGVVQSKNNNRSAEVAEARNHVGKVIAQNAYSKSDEVQFEVLFDSTVTLPGVGTKITMNDIAAERICAVSCKRFAQKKRLHKPFASLNVLFSACLHVRILPVLEYLRAYRSHTFRSCVNRFEIHTRCPKRPIVTSIRRIRPLRPIRPMQFPDPPHAALQTHYR